MQYVGETGRIFRKRLSEHKSGILGSFKGCKFLYNHFKQGCKIYTAKIIEAVPDSLDKEVNKDRLLDRENFWIRELRTKYPYGLNDKMLKEDYNSSIFRQFYQRPRNTDRKRNYIPRSKILRRLPPHLWIMDQHRKFAKDRRATRSGLVQVVMSATKSWIKLLSLLLADNTTSPIDDMIRDLCMAKLLSNNAKIPKINKPKILINHSCKWIGNLNFRKIFNNELCKSKWPQDKNEKFLKPMTIYKYDKKTSTLFFNYYYWLTTLEAPSIS